VADQKNKTRVLALASGGGHWVQLLRMMPAWRRCDVAYATTSRGYKADLEQRHERLTDTPARFYTFPDANRWQKLRLIRQLINVVWIVLREQPDVVISTGASAGYFAIRMGKLLGCRTIWVDSIANAGELSLAGARVGQFADLWLTQWPHLASSEKAAGKGPEYAGAVI